MAEPYKPKCTLKIGPTGHDVQLLVDGEDLITKIPTISVVIDSVGPDEMAKITINAAYMLVEGELSPESVVTALRAEADRIEGLMHG